MAILDQSFLYYIAKKTPQNTKKFTDRDRTRTCNPQIRSLMPYPLGHAAANVLSHDSAKDTNG